MCLDCFRRGVEWCACVQGLDFCLETVGVEARRLLG